MEFRRATEEDLDRLTEMHRAAYPDVWSETAHRHSFTANRFGRLEDVVVAVDRGQIAAHAFLFPFRMYFGGAMVKAGGIASVGVAPEARGRGIGSALMRQLHRLSDQRGDALTIIHAFRQGYYARFGYAPTSSRKRLAIDTRSIPGPWRSHARSRVRAVRGSDGKALAAVHACAAERSSGWIVRSKAFWDRHLVSERRILLVSEAPRPGPKAKSEVDGYVAFSLDQSEPHGETIIVVEELVYDGEEARRALLGALAAMRDQATEIILEVAESDPLERALVDSDGRRFGTDLVEHSLGEIVGGPMVRVEDVPRAIEARGYFDDGTFDLIVRDEEGAAMAVGVVVRDGRAEVGPPRRKSGAFSTSRAGVAAILYGGLSLTSAVALGLAEADARLAARVDAVVRIPPLTPIDLF